MTPTQVSLVKSSFQQVAPIAPQAASLFYGKLFELDPALRPLFKSDLSEQGDKLMKMIAMAVGSLDSPEQLVPVLRELGIRHAGYGVRESHYDTVGSALLWTLEQGLGDAFGPQVKTAWSSAYALIADTMIQSARDVG